MSNILHSSETNEWYTPPEVMGLVRAFLGGPVDLDPASCEVANRFVAAERYYTEEDDGLSLPWDGERVYNNPPYGGGTGKWVNKLLEEDPAVAVLLCNAVPDRKWFQRAWSAHSCRGVYFLDQRIKFIDEFGVQQSRPAHGNALIVFGDAQIMAGVQYPGFSGMWARGNKWSK